MTDTPTPAPQGAAKQIDILFSVGGNEREEGVFLHFGDCRIKVANNMHEFKQLPGRIQGMVDEALETDDELHALRVANATNKTCLADRLAHPDDEVMCVAAVYEVASVEPKP